MQFERMKIKKSADDHFYAGYDKRCFNFWIENTYG